MPDAIGILESLPQYKLIYLSGNLLTLYDAAGREKLHTALLSAKADGTKIAFDSNYRPLRWPDSATARTVMEIFLRLTDVAFPTLEDDMQIFCVKDATACAEYHHRLGVGEVVVKMGEHGCLLSLPNQVDTTKTVVQANSVDTTGAGNSFNAAYLSARANDQSPARAVKAAHRLAGTVIMHRSAVIPRTLMPEGGSQ